MARVGRPRAVPQRGDGDPMEEIVSASAAMFATYGYRATSTRAIAEAVGLRQASLFHYYPRKADILTELLDRTLRPTLEVAAALRRARLAPPAVLWALAHEDVTNLCRGPHNLGALQLLPEVRDPQFASFWRRRQRLIGAYRAVVRDGSGTRVFKVADATMAADLAFGMVESVITARPALRANTTTPVAVADGCLRLVGAGALPAAQRQEGLRAARGGTGSRNRNTAVGRA